LGKLNWHRGSDVQISLRERNSNSLLSKRFYNSKIQIALYKILAGGIIDPN
jgi:hypothetical protein